MKENFDTGSITRSDAGNNFGSNADNPDQGFQSRRGAAASAQGGSVDAWMVLDLLIKRWHWLLLGTILGSAVFGLLGFRIVRPKYTATAQLYRFETPGKSEYFKTPPISAETFAGLMRSPEILRRVGDALNPPVPGYLVNKWVKIDPEPDSDLVKIMAAGRTPDFAVNFVNLYASNAVEYIAEQDAKQAAVLADEYLKKQLTEMDQQINTIEDKFRGMPMAGLAGLDTNRLARIGQKVSGLNAEAGAAKPTMAGFTAQAQRLQTAMQELNDLLVKFTDEHPSVKAKREYIEELRSKMAAAQTNGAPLEAPLMALPGKVDATNPDIDIIHIKLRALEDARVDLSKRMEEAQLYALNKPASVRVFAPADLKTLKGNLHRVKAGIMTIFGALLGLALAIGLAMLVEFLDNRLKTPEDIARVTRLPVLGTLGDLRLMKPEDRTQWAFRTWTMLQGRLSPSANHGLICGITSATAGEGRSTWISLLAEAASLTGYRVLTVATRPSTLQIDTEEESASEDSEAQRHPAYSSGPLTSAVATNVLTTPQKITEQLTRPNSQPVVHIPLPGWVWNLERRNQWREALREWNQTENLVILVELPPATVPEAVLLGSNLPNMVWLTNSGVVQAAETRAHLQTLRHARCNLVGAVLNRVPNASLKSRFPRWVGALALLGVLSSTQLQAQTSGASPKQPNFAPIPGTAPQTPLNNQSNLALPAPADPAVPATNEQNVPAVAPPTNAPVPPGDDNGPQPNRTFSIVQPSQRAAWQQHLTLGPGDVLTLNLFGQPELARTEVTIGPDGRISYLEAQDVNAAGLTVDELRDRLDQEIGKYRRGPRTLITPIAFHSKKYYMLGKVATKGVYVLDRPMTVLEALARAHGFESALVDRNIYDLADFQHSFLARHGKRFPLDFEKLFEQGDLSQNLAIEPDDYIYVAGTDITEVYVLGEVRLPGTVSYTPQLTVIGAIAGRGGFTERAYRARVMVVRGSLNNPERIAVDTHAVVDGKGLDFKLKPRDVIYVSSRPFIMVEELADLAATAFIQSVITEWVGVDVVKPISQ